MYDSLFISDYLLTCICKFTGKHYSTDGRLSFLSKALLVISSKGIAESTGKIVGIPGVTTKTTVHLYLQRIENGEWIDVDDWIASNEAVSTTITKTRAVDKGYTYRTKASCYAYSGKKYERVISYSSEIKY